MPKTPREMGEAILANLKAKTGRTVEEWMDLLRRDGPPERKAQVPWLKQAHGLGSVQAAVVVGEAHDGNAYLHTPPEQFIAAQYHGQRALLRPVLDRVLELARALGPDVRVAPCKGYVPIIRRRQFAVVKPTTAARVDLGLVLPEEEILGRVKEARNLGGGERITRRVELRSPAEVDEEIADLLRRAYERDAR